MEKVIFLVGPTAVGKSEVAVVLAQAIGAEIISCDSMQVYKGMDVGTAKSSPRLKKEIPHHLIDILSPNEEYSCAEFSRRSKDLLREIIVRGKVPLVVGGSGLYVKALVDGIFIGPSPDRRLRKRLNLEAQRYGGEYLYGVLVKVDPKTASRLHPNDRRRIIRALEVYEKSGQPISELKPNRIGIASRYDINIVGLTRPREDLYQGINKRVDGMFDKGLVDEVRSLVSQGMGLISRQALGYKEVIGYLDAKYSLEEARRVLKRNTRHFAKRQLSWFRHDPRVKWIEVKKDEPVEDVVKKILVVIN